MAIFKDYYLILGISSDATSADIEKVVQERKKELYNQKGKDWLYSQDNTELREASEILLNPSNKAIYDQELELYNSSKDLDNYEIQNERLSRVIDYVQEKVKKGPISTGPIQQPTSIVEKVGKGCAFILLIIIAFMFKTCIGAVMKEKGKQDARNSYSYVIQSKTISNV